MLSAAAFDFLRTVNPPHHALLQRPRAPHVPAHTATDVHADDALERVGPAVVQLELRRRQRVRQQVVEREADLAVVAVGHQRVLLQLLHLALTRSSHTHHLQVVAAIQALLHSLFFTHAPRRHLPQADAQHAQVVYDAVVLRTQLARREQRLLRLRAHLLRDRVDENQSDLPLTRWRRTHLLLLTTPHATHSHLLQVLSQQLLQIPQQLVSTPHVSTSRPRARTVRRVVEARHDHLLLRLKSATRPHQRNALVQHAVAELLHAHPRQRQVQREQVFPPLVLGKGLDEVADVLDGRLRLNAPPRTHLALLRRLQETLRRSAQKGYESSLLRIRTARGQNVLVLVLAPDRVVVVQQHLARLLRALRPVLELRLTHTPHGYFATLADSQQVHRHGLRVTLPHRGYLVVYGVEQRHQRVERSVHQQQLALLRVTPDGIGDLLQHGLVVGDVLEHLRDDRLVPEGTYSSNKSAMSAHGYCFWKCTRGLMPRFTQMSTI